MTWSGISKTVPIEILEEDVVTFLDPPKELIPLDPDTYNPAAYLWSKIEDIPEERRLRLLSLIKQPRLISRAWEIAGMRYEDAKLAKKCGSDLLCCEDGEVCKLVEGWSGGVKGRQEGRKWRDVVKK
ncbi:unnamed protein product [Dovyalis caffra]|uniref:Uncharacterized protein n=1 Tax=Dovyalis caffra TaxID=77055 RepID=A0AAV1QPM3_9ROSI|nr:unnamed protein product [Dovyalis caffra]